MDFMTVIFSGIWFIPLGSPRQAASFTLVLGTSSFFLVQAVVTASVSTRGSPVSARACRRTGMSWFI